MGPLYNNKVINRISLTDLGVLADPELTPLGVDATIHNGCIISKIMKNIWKLNNNPDVKIDTVNLVCSSPLLRSMETAYYITRKWKNPPNKIYVLPHLRELDERSDDIYSQESLIKINSIPEYAMKSLYEQKQYLKSEGIIKFFDFSFVENDLHSRSQPGNIKVFIDWFSNTFIPILDFDPKMLNVFVVTHSGVLKEFSHQGFHNNSGFLLNTNIIPASKTIKFKSLYPFDKYLPDNFFTDYNNPEFANTSYYCPSKRCGQLCSIAKPSSSNSIKKFTSQCNPE
jgi:hypothetical protein